MRRTRAEFKSALQYCKKYEEQIRVDQREHSFDLGDAKGFWKNVHNDSVKKVTDNILRTHCKLYDVVFIDVVRCSDLRCNLLFSSIMFC